MPDELVFTGCLNMQCQTDSVGENVKIVSKICLKLSIPQNNYITRGSFLKFRNDLAYLYISYCKYESAKS